MDEFNVALSMIERSQEELTDSEREIHEFLVDLIAGKISPENYLKSLRLLRQLTAREEPPPKAKEPPAKPEPAQKKPVSVVTEEPSPTPRMRLSRAQARGRAEFRNEPMVGQARLRRCRAAGGQMRVFSWR